MREPNLGHTGGPQNRHVLLCANVLSDKGEIGFVDKMGSEVAVPLAVACTRDVWADCQQRRTASRSTATRKFVPPPIYYISWL